MTEEPRETRLPPPIEPHALRLLKSALDEGVPVIVELRLGAGTDLPERQVFHRYEMLVAFLRMVARPGDRLAAWRFDECCRLDNALVAPMELRAESS